MRVAVLTTLALWLAATVVVEAATTTSKRKKVYKMTSTSTTTAKKKKKTTVKKKAGAPPPQSALQGFMQNIGGVATANFLYSAVPQVIEYQGDDEETDFKESRMARIVQFYSPYCVSFVF